jgi:hypothetical protein
MENLVTPPIYKVKSKRNILLAIVGVYVASFFATWLFASSLLAYQLITLFTTVGISVAVLMWCNIDAQQRRVKLGPAFRIAVVLLSPIALTYYFIKSRGIKRGLISILKSFAFALALIVVGMVMDFSLALIDDRLGYFKSFR